MTLDEATKAALKLVVLAFAIGVGVSALQSCKMKKKQVVEQSSPAIKLDEIYPKMGQ